MSCCGECRFYVEETAASDTEPGNGFCVRYAPRPFPWFAIRGLLEAIGGRDWHRDDRCSFIHDGQEPCWPRVMYGERCGEFQSQPDARGGVPAGVHPSRDAAQTPETSVGKGPKNA